MEKNYKKTHCFDHFRVRSGNVYRKMLSCLGNAKGLWVALFVLCGLGISQAQTIYTENFDGSWTSPAPTNWASNRAANNANAWHRNDYTTNWSFPTGGSPAAAGAASTTYYARFHTYGISNANAHQLYPSANIDLSSYSSSSLEFKFYYINPTGSDNVQLQFSSNGGTSFTTVQTYTTQAAWQEKTVVISAAYAVSTFRFRLVATSDYGDDDIGVDQVSIAAVSCGSPSAAAINLTSATTATVSWTAPAGSPSGYEYVLSTSATAPASGTATTATSVTGITLTPNATNYLYVRSNCSGSYSSWSSTSLYVGYCTPAPLSQDGSGITNFTMGSINNTTGSETGYYGNYTALSASAGQGTSQAFSITMGTSYIYNVKMWVDWNNDYDFTDSGEEVYSAQMPSATNPTVLSGSFTVPAGASLGTHRLRIGGTDYAYTPTPCYTGSYATYEDYTLNVTTPPSCFAPTGLAMAATSTATATISWTAPAQGSPVGYEYAVTTSSTAPASGTSTTATSVTGVPITFGQTYYLYVRTVCSSSESTWVAYSVYLGYCTPVITYGCADGDVIARVVLNTLDNNSGTGCPSDPNPNDSSYSGAYQGGYSDYSANESLSTILQAGASYNCTVYAGQYTEGYAAWIDYNDDGIFDNATERIGYSNGTVTGSGQVGVLGSSASFPIVLACNPPVGAHRLRIRAVFNTSGANITPCGNVSYGEVEDYTIKISAADPCPAPTTLTATSVTSSGATLTWNTGCAETQWEMALQAAGSGTPSTGTQVSANSYAASGLTPGTSYEYYVRAVCTPGSLYSNWSGPYTFSTLPPAPNCSPGPIYPTNAATAVPVVDGIITLQWQVPAGTVTSYNVYAGTTSGSLTLITSVTTNSVQLTGFAYSTTYYWRIVPVNTGGTATGCSEWSFTTQAVPANDLCSGATSLDALISPLSSTTAGLGHQYTLSCLTTSTAPDAFYSITVPPYYTLSIGQTFNTYDSVNEVFYGSCASPTLIQCFDDDYTTVVWQNTTGTTQTVYWVQSGYNAGSGQFTLAWTLTAPPACGAPVNLTATQLSLTTADLSWAPANGTVTGYEYAVTTSATPPASGTATTATSLSGFTGTTDTTYYLHVRVVCDSGNSTWSTLSFYLGYCIPASVNGCTDEDVISRVVLNTLDNDTGTACPGGVSGYSNYSADPLLTTTLQAGGSYNCTIYSGYWSEGYAVWIDYDDDGIFDNATERIGYSDGMIGEYTSATFPIYLSCSPPVGQHRLRVRAMFNTAGVDVTPCTANSYGEVEDYTITITAPDPCPAPHNLAANSASITTTGATLTWTQGCEETVWEVAVVANGAGAPAGSGTAVSVMTYSAAGLTPNTAYQFYVRAVCEEGVSYSTWAGPFNFTTRQVNDLCSGAISLDALASPMTGNTANAADNFTPGCTLYAANDLFYSVTVLPGYTLNISQESDFDTVISVFYGSCSSQTSITCFDDPDDNLVSWTNTTGATQTVYWVEDGYDGESGSFTLSWTLTAPTCFTWTGATSTNWNAGSNWCGSVVPTSADDVTIPNVANDPVITSGNVYAHNLTLGSGAVLTVNTGATLSVDNILSVNPTATLIVQDNAALLQGESTVTNANSGSITLVKKSSPLFRLDYTLWSSPVTGLSLYTFSPATSGNRFYEYKYDTNGTTYAEAYWPVVSSTQFTPAKGYLIRMPNVLSGNVTGTTNDGITTPAEYIAGTDNYIYNGTFTGAPNNGTVTYPLSTVGDKYTAIGNPYPSPISLVDFFDGNDQVIDLSSGIYFWRKRNNSANSSYATLSLGGYVANPAEGGGSEQGAYFSGSNSSWTLAPGQGFMVKTAASVTSGSVTFTNAMRTPSSGASQAFFKSAGSTPSRLWLNMAAENGTTSQTMVGYFNSATLGIDYGFDAQKFTDGNAVTFYSLAETTPLAIQARPGFEVSDVVPMGFTVPNAGTFTVTLDHVDGLFANGQKIYLRDNTEGIVRDLTQLDYTFSSEAGTFEGRFDVIYTTQALGTDNPALENNKVMVYTEGNVIGINSGNAMMDNVTIFDIRGRKLYSQSGISNTELKISNLTAEQQVLILEVDTVNGKVSKRIVF